LNREGETALSGTGEVPENFFFKVAVLQQLRWNRGKNFVLKPFYGLGIFYI